MIEFIWWRCLDGYELREKSVRRLRERETPSLAPVEMQQPTGRSRQSIRSRSERFESYAPANLGDPALFRAFASISTPHEVLSFCDIYGVPSRGARTDLSPPRGVPLSVQIGVDEILTESSELRSAIESFNAGRTADLVHAYNQRWASVRHELREIDGKVTRILVPMSLTHFFWMQFAEHLETGAETARCEKCGKWFSRGAGKGRRDKKYCSNACKQAAFVERKGG